MMQQCIAARAQWSGHLGELGGQRGDADLLRRETTIYLEVEVLVYCGRHWRDRPCQDLDDMWALL